MFIGLLCVLLAIIIIPMAINLMFRLLPLILMIAGVIWLIHQVS
jgi:hypothetical protein